MTTHILTWNPAQWPKTKPEIEELNGLIADAARGRKPENNWNSGEHQLSEGDRVFLLRQGSHQGLVGCGVVSKYLGRIKHFRDDRLVHTVTVQWDELLSAHIPIAVLKSRVPSVRWTPRRSGPPVSDQDAVLIEELWSGAQDEPPLIFLRISWMEFYQGLTPSDPMSGAGSFVEQQGYGHEMFNFQPLDGRMYGYVRPGRGGGDFVDGAGIALERLGAWPADAPFMKGVLVVWVATSPKGGMWVVGWYENARVFRRAQSAPDGSNRIYKDEKLGYYVTASMNDATLLRLADRTFAVPGGKNAFGQSNVWYADKLECAEIRKKIRAHVSDFSERPPKSPFAPRQSDVAKRIKIEKAACKLVEDHFVGLGYLMKDVSAENRGWDLEATRNDEFLRLEVKGLSGGVPCVELTPNEYGMMSEHQQSFRLCVVTSALAADPQLLVFAFRQDAAGWMAEEKRLRIEERTGARCSVM